MSRAVHAMINILEQQELEVEEAQASAADTIQPATVQVKVCSVEQKGAASNLPVGDVASEGTTEDAGTGTRPQAAPAESGMGSAEAPAAAADIMQPAAEQVQVCSVELMDTASNLPVGNVTSEDTMQPAVVQASRPQVALVEGGGHCAEVQEAADHQAANARQPAVAQVQVCGIDSVDASPHLPVSSSSEAS